MKRPTVSTLGGDKGIYYIILISFLNRITVHTGGLCCHYIKQWNCSMLKNRWMLHKMYIKCTWTCLKQLLLIHMSLTAISSRAANTSIRGLWVLYGPHLPFLATPSAHVPVEINDMAKKIPPHSPCRHSWQEGKDGVALQLTCCLNITQWVAKVIFKAIV